MPRIVDTRSVLAVRNLEASVRFYVDVLGLRESSRDGTGSWSFLSRDAFNVMLGECPNERPATDLGDHSYVAYVIVEGIDQLYEEIAARGAAVISPPVTEPWGMREFGIRTPDGHRIRFGEQVGALA